MPALILFMGVGGSGGGPIRDIIGGGIAKGTDDAIELELDTSGIDPGGTNVD